MDGRSVLALLTTKVQHFALAPGGNPRFTPEDVAHALGKLKSESAALYARVKYCAQIEFAEDLALSARRQFLLEIYDAKLWRIPRPHWILDMISLAVAEAIHEHICPWCKGIAESINKNGLRISCEACKATGKKYWRDSDRAHLMGTSKQAWSAHWSKRYQDIQTRTVDRYEDLIAAAIPSKLR